MPDSPPTLSRRRFVGPLIGVASAMLFVGILTWTILTAIAERPVQETPAATTADG